MWEETQRIIWFSSADHADPKSVFDQIHQDLELPGAGVGLFRRNWLSELPVSKRERGQFDLFSSATYSISKLNLKILI